MRCQKHCLRLASTVASDIKSRTSVAVIGGGISSCTAAEELAQQGFKVNLFEVGRGVGGRSSTRRHAGFQFDHGVQYITAPRSNYFEKRILQWMEKGIVKTWEGTFSHVSKNGSQVVWTRSNGGRYVGSPQMNSICRSLAQHPNILCKFECKVSATPEVNAKGEFLAWRLTSVNTGEDLGRYDWLVVGDRSATVATIENSFALNSPSLQNFKQALTEQYKPIPLLALMITFKRPIPKEFFPHDSIHVQGYKAIGWIARDSSKPERNRADGQECWVIQSHSNYAAEVIKEVTDAAVESGEELTVEERKRRVTALATERLFQAFYDFLLEHTPPEQTRLISQLLLLENMSAIQGHRWGAAFPSFRQPLVTILDTEAYKQLGRERCYVDTKAHFASCGDYLPADSAICGKVEGAVCSGHVTARAVGQAVLAAEEALAASKKIRIENLLLNEMGVTAKTL
eukprot:gene9151-10102_t